MHLFCRIVDDLIIHFNSFFLIFYEIFFTIPNVLTSFPSNIFVASFIKSILQLLNYFGTTPKQLGVKIREISDVKLKQNQ